MKALIIEDEPQAISALKEELYLHCSDIEVIGVAMSVEEAIKKIEKLKPELIFLDIQLSDGYGFDILDYFEKIDFKIIFTTAYSEYALQAIKTSALDYLLKPINSKELKNAVEKAENENQKELLKRVDVFIKNHKREDSLKKIALQTSEGIFVYDIFNIIKCISDGNYTKIHLVNGKKILVSKTLKELEKILSIQNFERIHHSHIININHLISYNNKDGGYVVMSDKSTLTVSQRRKSDFIKKLETFNF
ncbi:MAG: LytR/AlgR family response regulator transcription factor [Polaribacter sp.]